MNDMPGVTEIATFFIEQGSERGFVTGFRVGKLQIEASPGFRSLRLVQGVETPTTFVLLVEWDSLDAHQAFRASHRLAEWRAHVNPYFAKPPTMEHYVTV